MIFLAQGCGQVENGKPDVNNASCRNSGQVET